MRDLLLLVLQSLAQNISFFDLLFAFFIYRYVYLWVFSVRRLFMMLSNGFGKRKPKTVHKHDKIRAK